MNTHSTNTSNPIPVVNFALTPTTSSIGASKQFKVCGTCKIDKPLRKFNKWNNVPHRNCQKCWEAEYVKKRAEGREKAAGNKRVDISGECARRPTVLSPEADNMRVLYQRAMEERANIQRRMDVDPEGMLREIFAANNFEEQDTDQEVERAMPEYARRKAH